MSMELLTKKQEKAIEKVLAKKHSNNRELGEHTINAYNVDAFLSKIIKDESNPDPLFIVIDLFCGAGGTTTGFCMTDGLFKVVGCVNHDFKAIKSHWHNHPEVAHFEEDIRTLDLRPLVRLVDHYRNLYPNAKIILWASLECTNFSKAKGGQPRDADSRTLADHLERYILALNPDYVQIENVVEFMSWGPLDENGKPVSRRNGSDWMRWRNVLCSLGYYDEWKELNSADFGAYTSRNRLFGCFARIGLPIVWPQATHAKKVYGGMFGTLKPWMAVKEVLDFADEGESIFGRKKDLSEKTLERIYAGLVKYVAGGKDAYMIKYMGNDAKTGINNGKSLDEPSPVIATSNRLGLVQASFIQKYYSGKPEGKVISTEGPAGTVCCVDTQALVQAKFITQRNSGSPDGRIIDINGPARTLTSTGGNQDIISTSFLSKAYSGSPDDKNIPVSQPAGTITTVDHHQLVSPKYLIHYYGSGGQHSSIETPAPVIPTKARTAVINPKWLDKQYTGAANHQSIDRPAGSILANDKHCLISPVHFIDRNFSGGGQNSSVEQPAGSVLSVPKLKLIQADQAFVMGTNFDNNPTSIDNPLPVITANRKWHYLVNPSWFGHPTGTDQPAPVIIARQDKAPMYLVITEEGELGIVIYETDTPCMKKIKEFMALYGIIDIKMRMLKVPELLLIQGFPTGYHLAGNQSDQKKFIGNSVVPLVVKAMALALAGAHSKDCKTVAA